jgi:hypothetical protein
MYKLTSSTTILRADGACIPADPENTDYAAYLAWQAEGNTPDPADIPDPKVAIQIQIDSLERTQLLPRITREFMLGLSEATYPPEILALNEGYRRLKEFDEQIIALRVQL